MNLPIKAFSKDPDIPITDNLISSIVIPFSKEGILARVYKIYQKDDEYTATWQLYLHMLENGKPSLIPKGVENDLGKANWNGSAWVAEKDPPDIDLHRKSLHEWAEL